MLGPSRHVGASVTVAFGSRVFNGSGAVWRCREIAQLLKQCAARSLTGSKIHTQMEHMSYNSIKSHG